MTAIKILLPDDIMLSTDHEIVINLNGKSLKEFVVQSEKSIKRFNFLESMDDIIATLHKENHSRTAETYSATRRRFSLFLNNKDIRIDEVNEKMLKDFERHIIDSGNTQNTVSFYMRILRATYYKSCLSAKIPANKQLFKAVYTGEEKTEKRAISIEELNMLQNFKTKSLPMTFARDIFLFSFYTRGMSFVDIAHLKKTNISEGKLTYRRAKTGQLLQMKWEPCMQAIVDMYNIPDSPYLLPIISDEEKARAQYRNKQNSVNVNLKKIGKQIGTSKKLTLYVARHSWATIAKQLNVPLAVISDAMGHNNVKTTMIYLDSINSDVIDDANALIISKLQ